MVGLCSYAYKPDMWFPEMPAGRPSIETRNRIAYETTMALAICGECPIKSDCLREGMKSENLENGIWGGLLAGERILLAGVDTNRSIRRDAITFAEGIRAWQELARG